MSRQLLGAGATIFTFLSMHSLAAADCDLGLKLQDYEPNSVVVRKDDIDDTHLNFTLSQMYPIAHDGCIPSQSRQGDWWFVPYFSFTGEFAFYLFGDRNSSPVIGRRFNPKLFFRNWIGDGRQAHLDIGLTHESNGQSVNSEELYLQRVAEEVAHGQPAASANDYISRGWDFLDLTYKHQWEIINRDVSVYLNLNYYLDQGPLQGESEEVWAWETDNGEGKSRSEVDGISLLLKSSSIRLSEKFGMKVAFKYTTGYDNPFRHDSYRMEITTRLFDLPPFIIWASKGYNSSLTNYYRDVATMGVGFEFRNFLSDL